MYSYTCYRDDVDDTKLRRTIAFFPLSDYASHHQQGLAVWTAKRLQQNPPVHKWGCQLYVNMNM